MKAPFPWFGGKRRVASEIWAAFGDVDNYVEPFAGSLAVLLERPTWHRAACETVNDADKFLANFWRALAHDPQAVAEHCDWPVNECLAAGTMISTPKGRVPIEQITAGDSVYGVVNGERVVARVLATKQSRAASLLSVCGLRITPEHEIWTTSGYIPARALTASHVICRLAGEHDAEMVHLRAGSSRHGRGALCRSNNAETTQAVGRASMSSAEGRADASGLLASFACNGPKVDCVGAGNGRRLARGGGALDCASQADATPDQPHKRRGRHARTAPDASAGVSRRGPICLSR